MLRASVWQVRNGDTPLETQSKKELACLLFSRFDLIIGQIPAAVGMASEGGESLMMHNEKRRTKLRPLNMHTQKQIKTAPWSPLPDCPDP